jgi:hypothetical protein
MTVGAIWLSAPALLLIAQILFGNRLPIAPRPLLNGAAELRAHRVTANFISQYLL